MKKDIKFPKVEGVSLAIGRQPIEAADADAYEYRVYIINENEFPLSNVIINSTGYNDTHKTSTLRHFLETLEPNSVAPVELIETDLFALVNQFWVSYYRGDKVFDKKFVFLPESITDENFQYIEALELEGVLHA
jgi:hypothetical protein